MSATAPRGGLALTTLYLHYDEHDNFHQPEIFMKASGELLAILITACTAITYFVHPQVYDDNPVLRLLGYNNFCVSWDSPPALYLAGVAFSFISYHSIRFCRLNVRSAEVHGFTGCKLRVVKLTSCMFGLSVCVLPLICVVTPDKDPYMHSALFLQYIPMRWIMVAVSFYSWPEFLPTQSKMFLAVYGLVSLEVVVLFYLRVSGLLVLPPVVMQVADWVWFLCLPTTSLMTPAHPGLHVHRESEIRCQVEANNRQIHLARERSKFEKSEQINETIPKLLVFLFTMVYCLLARSLSTELWHRILAVFTVMLVIWNTLKFPYTIRAFLCKKAFYYAGCFEPPFAVSSPFRMEFKSAAWFKMIHLPHALLIEAQFLSVVLGILDNYKTRYLLMLNVLLLCALAIPFRHNLGNRPPARAVAANALLIIGSSLSVVINVFVAHRSMAAFYSTFLFVNLAPVGEFLIARTVLLLDWVESHYHIYEIATEETSADDSEITCAAEMEDSHTAHSTESSVVVHARAPIFACLRRDRSVSPCRCLLNQWLIPKQSTSLDARQH